MKKLIGGIVCLFIGLLVQFTDSTLFNIEINGVKSPLSGILDTAAAVVLIVVGVLLVLAYLKSKKK